MRGEEDRRMENGTFFLKSLSSLPGFSCHRKKKDAELAPRVHGIWSPLPPAPPRVHSL